MWLAGLRISLPTSRLASAFSASRSSSGAALTMFLRLSRTAVSTAWLRCRWVAARAPVCAAALIPPAVGYDNPNYILGHGQMDDVAEARLINDNLLDFSHLSYVHINSFGANEEWARGRPKVTTLENGVRVERWLKDTS